MDQGDLAEVDSLDPGSIDRARGSHVLIMGFALNDLFSDPVVPMTATEYVLAVTTFPATFLAFVFAGAFVFSSEYASGMILSTLTAAPRREYVLTAKALVLTAISSAAALASGIRVSMLQVPEVADVLGSTQVLTGMLGTVFFLVAISLFAFAVAGARSTAGAITVVVGILSSCR